MKKTKQNITTIEVITTGVLKTPRSVVQKLERAFGGSWAYVHIKGFWIDDKGRYALISKGHIYVSPTGKYYDYPTRDNDARSPNGL